MDLYEALKAGTSADELMAAFRKDLDESAARLKKEQEEAAKVTEDAEYLADCRELLAEAMIDYADALLGEDASSSIPTVDTVIKILEASEKGFKESVEGLKTIDKLMANLGKDIDTPVKVTTATIGTSKCDDDIISKFLKGLC